MTDLCDLPAFGRLRGRARSVHARMPWLPWSLLFLLFSSLCQAATNGSDSLIWGAYRPNLYFGLRPRLPQSLMTGLIWFGAQDYPNFMRASAVDESYSLWSSQPG